MATVSAAALLLLVASVVLHYELLRGISMLLPRLPMRSRAKLLAVVFAAFSAHAVEILLYGIAFHLLSRVPGAGGLVPASHSSLSTCIYLSGETFTSLGFGDVVPTGPLRLLAGAECLNGLLLIGWSASYIYISMERFWNRGNGE